MVMLPSIEPLPPEKIFQFVRVTAFASSDTTAQENIKVIAATKGLRSRGAYIARFPIRCDEQQT